MQLHKGCEEIFRFKHKERQNSTMEERNQSFKRYIHTGCPPKLYPLLFFSFLGFQCSYDLKVGGILMGPSSIEMVSYCHTRSYLQISTQLKIQMKVSTCKIGPQSGNIFQLVTHPSHQTYINAPQINCGINLWALNCKRLQGDP